MTNTMKPNCRRATLCLPSMARFIPEQLRRPDQVPLHRGEVGVVKHEGLDGDRRRQGDDGQLHTPEAQGRHADEDPDGGGEQGRDEQGPGEPDAPVDRGFREQEARRPGEGDLGQRHLAEIPGDDGVGQDQHHGDDAGHHPESGGAGRGEQPDEGDAADDDDGEERTSGQVDLR